jgi:predicted transcriptional regulator
MKPTNLSTRRQQAIARALRDLEREGLIESRLDQEGNVRWYSTEKIRHVRPDEVHVSKDLLN